jgi:hypothetical protein
MSLHTRGGTISCLLCGRTSPRPTSGHHLAVAVLDAEVGVACAACVQEHQIDREGPLLRWPTHNNDIGDYCPASGYVATTDGRCPGQCWQSERPELDELQQSLRAYTRVPAGGAAATVPGGPGSDLQVTQ